MNCKEEINTILFLITILMIFNLLLENFIIPFLKGFGRGYKKSKK